MKDYTDATGPIIRSRRWPSAESTIGVVISSSNWPAGVDGWTWNLEFSTENGDSSVLSLEADSVTLSGNDLTAQFYATAQETAQLVGADTFLVEVTSDNTATEEDPSTYDTMQGWATVRDLFERS